jgi:hypothetical protein
MVSAFRPDLGFLSAFCPWDNWMFLPEILPIYGIAGFPMPSYWIYRCFYQLSACGMVGSSFLLYRCPGVRFLITLSFMIFTLMGLFSVLTCFTLG